MDDDERTRLTAAIRRATQDGERALTQIAELATQVETLVDILARGGSLKPGHVKLLGKVAQSVSLVRTPKLELSDVDDKYEVVGDDVDCASRIPLCQARCCSFGVVLSRQDLEEGEVAWDIDHPYRLPRLADGYCTYIGGGDGRCTNYQHRPATCRSYSCRDDARVWIDFDARIPAPMPETVVPLVQLRRK
ncbi:MAG: YkgJ family cysteine cluster protein [Proteobacteria bacterium]|nr:YkgJ family cysteine cluster protein [Pseudomonadota bacterium]